MENETKKRTRRSTAELLKESEKRTKKLKLKEKSEKEAAEAKIAKNLYTAIKKELSREIKEEDIVKIRDFCRSQLKNTDV